MQKVMYLFPLMLGVVMILGASTALIRHLKKNQKPGWTIILSGVIAIALMFFMFKAVYKPYGLYENHFKQACQMNFPTEGEYMFADTWIDDAESDGYSSISLIALNPEDIHELKTQLKSLDYGTISDSIKQKENFDDRLNYVLALSKSKIIVEEFGLTEKRQEKRNGMLFKVQRIRYYFGFLDDQKTVVVYIISK